MDNELLQALEKIQEECKKYEKCVNCPMDLGEKKGVCYQKKFRLIGI